MAEHLEPLWLLGIPATVFAVCVSFGFLIDGRRGAALAAAAVIGVLLLPASVAFFLWMTGILDG